MDERDKAILMVVTSADHIDAQHRTGLWFEEFAVPYTLFRQAGYRIVVASPQGGDAPIDPRSLDGVAATPGNEEARAALHNTRHLDATIDPGDFEAIFFPGGHGTMFDLPDNTHVQHLIAGFFESGKPIGSVCHGPAGFVGTHLHDGTPLVKGRRLTAFTDAEERAVHLDGHMPFLLESRLRELGAEFVTADNWADNVVVDGLLVTGQNPQSSASAAKALIRTVEAVPT